jgi:hypothetical protein
LKVFRETKGRRTEGRKEDTERGGERIEETDEDRKERSKEK